MVKVNPVETETYFSHARTEIEPLLPASTASVLEIGCGAGSTMAWLKSIRSVEYSAAVELFAEAGEQARRVFDEVEIGPVESAEFAFRERSFDLILALDVLEHLPDPYAMVRKLRALLKPGGVIVASLPNVSHYSVASRLFFSGQWDYQNEGILDRTHLRFFVAKTAAEMFESAAFSDVQVSRKFMYPNVFALIGQHGQKWRWYSQKLLGRILLWPSHLFAVQLLVRARRAD